MPAPLLTAAARRPAPRSTDLLPDGSIRVPQVDKCFLSPYAASLAVVQLVNPQRSGGAKGWQEIYYKGSSLQHWREQLPSATSSSGNRGAAAAAAAATQWQQKKREQQQEQALPLPPPQQQPLPQQPPPQRQHVVVPADQQLRSFSWQAVFAEVANRPALGAACAGAGSLSSGPAKCTPALQTPAGSGAPSDLASAASSSLGQGKRPAGPPPLPADPAKRQQQGPAVQQPESEPAAASLPSATAAAATAALAELSAALGQASQQEEAQAAGVESQLCNDFRAGEGGRGWLCVAVLAPVAAWRDRSASTAHLLPTVIPSLPLYSSERPGLCRPAALPRRRGAAHAAARLAGCGGRAHACRAADPSAARRRDALTVCARCAVKL